MIRQDAVNVQEWNACMATDNTGEPHIKTMVKFCFFRLKEISLLPIFML